MKRFFISLFLFINTSFVAFSQTPTISMTTTLGVGSQISFSICGNSSSTPIQIDWGNGVKENYTIGDMDEAFGFPVKGSTIKIWGSGIEGFNIQSKELTAMEFYQATSLKTLFCKGNKLTTLNLSDCPALTLVECKQNLISNLTLPSTTTLTYVDCSDNNLTLATLPIKQATWTDFIYSPQKEYKLPKSVYEVNEEIDLSSQFTINGNTTNYTWKTKGGTTLINGTDFSANNGKFTFLKTNIDSVYCEMVNAAFPTLTLSTTKLAIVPPSAISMITTNSVGSTFSFSISSTTNNTLIYVDFGNGILTGFTINIGSSDISGSLAGSNIKIYGTGISSFVIYSKNITMLDISKCIELQTLSCDSNQLISLDVSENTLLKYINCFNNKLVTLDISKNFGLTNLCCGANQLSTLDVSKNTSLTYLHCAYNQLSSLDVTQNTSLTVLNCANNQLSSLDVSKNTSLTHLYCHDNKLAAIDILNNTYITNLECYYNQLSALNVSNNTALKELYCYANKLTTLDVSKNISLQKLECSSNKLTILDVSNNTDLTDLLCSYNQIITLDVSKNTSLQKLNCNKNYLTVLDVSINTSLTQLNCNSNFIYFNTLPVKQSSWTTYSYSPQNKLVLPNKNYILSENIDLSSQLSVNGNTTSYVWKTKGGTTLTAETDYSITNGVTTFLKVQTDSVYCEMTNATFPDLTLTTTNVKITQYHTDVNEISLSAKLFPNPVKDLLNIECKENISKVEIYSITGAKHFERNGGNSESMNIPTGDLPKGMLIVKVYCKNGIIEKKIIKE